VNAPVTPINLPSDPAPAIGRLRRLRRRRNGMFGIPEILALGVSALFFLIVPFSYLYFLRPANNRSADLQRERARLQTLLRSAQLTMQKDNDTKTTVENITGSMEEFESQHLASATAGRMDLYDGLNELIKKNGLRNTSGPTYTALEPIGAKVNTVRSTSTKWQSVYPGIAISVTVEGSYQNLRHFVRGIEANKQFVIINEVELERATENNRAVAADGSATPRPSLVSLRLEMATYFQRAAAQEESSSAEQH
jgi:Tfp pilus assembly protein PilO